MSVCHKRHQMKTLSRVVIVPLIIENVGKDVIFAESKRCVLARRIHDPQNHIAIAFKQGKSGEKVGKGTRFDPPHTFLYSKRCV